MRTQEYNYLESDTNYRILHSIKMIRLIIADDHPVIIDGIRTILEKVNDIELVAEVNSGAQLIKLLENEKADVILMDVNMPDINGIDATRIISNKYPEIKILAFSQYDEKRFVKLMLKTGASGYMLKNTSGAEIEKAVKMVNKGGIYLSAGLPNVFGEKPKKKSSYLFPDISPRELDVLRQICLEQNTHEIAEALFISPNTVETHRANLLLKVGVKNTAGLVKWAIENEIV